MTTATRQEISLSPEERNHLWEAAEYAYVGDMEVLSNLTGKEGKDIAHCEAALSGAEDWVNLLILLGVEREREDGDLSFLLDIYSEWFPRVLDRAIEENNDFIYDDNGAEMVEAIDNGADRNLFGDSSVYIERAYVLRDLRERIKEVDAPAPA